MLSVATGAEVEMGGVAGAEVGGAEVEGADGRVAVGSVSGVLVTTRSRADTFDDQHA